MAWMAWTWPTAAFFATIALLLVIFSVLAIRYPETPRRGILGIETTRGDRLFISLVACAFLCLVWLGLGIAPMLYAPIACLALAAVIFRTV